MLHFLFHSVLPEFDQYLVIYSGTILQYQLKAQKDKIQVLKPQMCVFLSV
jgi:hypothetical protein